MKLQMLQLETTVLHDKSWGTQLENTMHANGWTQGLEREKKILLNYLKMITGSV